MHEMGNAVQHALFHESIEDALGTCVSALGGPKKVGAWLYPAATVSAAEARVRSNLNPERDHKFSPGEIELLGARAREAGCFALQEYLAKVWTCEFRPLSPDVARKRQRRLQRRALIDALLRLDEDPDEVEDEES